MAAMRLFVLVVFSFLTLNSMDHANGAIHGKTQTLIHKANKEGPYLGIVIPNTYEMNPLLVHPSYKPSNFTINFAGRKFRFATLAGEKVISVMTGLAMMNSAIGTQLLLSLFDIKTVLHYGISGNANPHINNGDVVIAEYWSHTTLWSWQKYGDGPEDELPFEPDGDYTREIGYMRFADYATNVSKHCKHSDNLLNRIWYQPEEIFPVDGTPEERQHAFWVPVDSDYFKLSKKLETMKLENCVDSSTCLPVAPKVKRVLRGTGANIYVDNAAYSDFMYDKFEVTPVDMESAAMALVCYTQRVPYIAFRAISLQNDEFAALAASNSVEVMVEFIKIWRRHISKTASNSFEEI